MAPLPKRRHSTRRQGARRHAQTLSWATSTKCVQCGASKLSHRPCPSCGYYSKDIQLETDDKKKAKAKKS